MTALTTTRITPYTGDGATVDFPTIWAFYKDTDIQVIERTIATGAEVTKTITTDYTVTGGDIVNGATGTVVAVSAPASTVQWHIRRVLPRTQTHDLPVAGLFPADLVENADDRATFVSQEIEEEVSRTLKTPATDPTSSLGDIPNSVARATKVLAFDSDGKPVVSALTLDGIESGATDAAASAVTAANEASNAASSASAASTSETNAGISETNAAASAASIPSTPFSIANGGTGATTDSGARTSLGLVIGTDVLAPNGNGSQLTGISAGDAWGDAVNADIVPDIDSTRDLGSVTKAFAELRVDTIFDGITSDSVPAATVVHGTAKAWADVSYSGGVPSIDASYGVTSVTDQGVGQLTFNWSVTFSSSNYSTLVSGSGSGSSFACVATAGNLERTPTIKTTSLFNCDFRSATGTLFDPSEANVIAFGDLA